MWGVRGLSGVIGQFIEQCLWSTDFQEGPIGGSLKLRVGQNLGPILSIKPTQKRKLTQTDNVNVYLSSVFLENSSS